MEKIFENVLNNPFVGNIQMVEEIFEKVLNNPVVGNIEIFVHITNLTQLWDINENMLIFWYLIINSLKILKNK